jgi:hypothetical protein
VAAQTVPSGRPTPSFGARRQQLNQQFLSFAANLVSFCGEGVRKIAPTRFEMRKSDFTPKSDLYVLILERRSN